MKTKIILFFMLIGLVFPVGALADLSEGVKLYMPLDGNVDDISGNNFNITSYGTAFVQDMDENVSSAIYFNGDDNTYIDTGSNGFNFPNLTVAFWINADESGTTTENQIIFNKQSLTAGWSAIYDRDSRNVHEHIRIFPNQPWGTPGMYVLYNTWKHAVFTITSDNIYRLYVDGIHVGSTQHPAGDRSSDANLVIGKRSNIPDFPGAGFQGMLDEIAIWNRVLSEEEVSALYNNGGKIVIDPPAQNDPSVKLDLPFDGDATDASGNPDIGTPIVTGAILTTDKNGVENSAYYFDGNSYIDILGSAELAYPDMTVTFDMKADVSDSKVMGYIIDKKEGGATGAGWSAAYKPDVKNGYFLSYSDKSKSAYSFIDQGAWHSIMVTISSSQNKLKYYVDGRQVFNGSANAGDRSNSVAVRIGKGHTGKGFIGKLDNIKIYDRIITDTCTEDDTGVIDIQPMTAQCGASGVALPIKITDTPNAVSAFGYDISYDTDSLTYTGYSTTDTLVAGFNAPIVK